MMTPQSYYRKNKDRERLELIKEYTDIGTLLEALGVGGRIKERKSEFRGPCPVHGGDNKTAFVFFKDSKRWECFSHKCDEDYSNDVFGFVMAIRKCSFLDAVKFVESITPIAKDPSKYRRYRRRLEDKKFIEKYVSKVHKPDCVSEEHLRRYKHFRSGLFNSEGFSDDTLNYFEVGGGYIDEQGCQRDVIPLRNDEGVLEGYSLRDIRKELLKEEEDYKYIITEGTNKDRLLYNLHNVAGLGVFGVLVLVEGFKAVWRLYDYGIYNVAAVMGSKVTHGQIDILCKYPFDRVVLFFDGDVPGIKGATTSALLLRNYIKHIDVVYSTDEGKDPADLTKEQVYSYLKKYMVV